MKVFHVEFAKTGYGISGGEKCMIEIIKHFKFKKLGNVLLTTDNGKQVYQELGLFEDEYLKFVTINSSASEKRFHIFISYIWRVFLFLKIKKRVAGLINSKEDVLMCHSDFFPNVIPSYFLTKFFQKKSFWWFHMLAPDILKGYEGHFTKRLKMPSFAVIHYKLNQFLFYWVSSIGTIITVNPYYQSLFKNRNAYTLRKFGGEDVYTIKKYAGISVPSNHVVQDEKSYDLVFMGRFHRQKGILEIPKILKILKQKKSDISLLVIGDGDQSVKEEFFAEIKKEGLESNVKYLGFINSDKKFEFIRKAKVFIFPSYYESFGQVALEAMANGLPVVAYDLPIFSVFEKGMTKIPILNNLMFAQAAFELISDSVRLERASKEAVEYVSTFSWAKTGDEVFDLISKI